MGRRYPKPDHKQTDDERSPKHCLNQVRGNVSILRKLATEWLILEVKSKRDREKQYVFGWWFNGEGVGVEPFARRGNLVAYEVAPEFLKLKAISKR